MGHQSILRLAALALCLLLWVTACAGAQGVADGQDKTPADVWQQQEQLKALSPEDIRQIKVTFTTEGGVRQEEIDAPDAIRGVYELLLDLSLGERTSAAVEDAGLLLEVSAKEQTLSFSFEHNILVLDGEERYQVDHLGALRSYLNGLFPEV